MHLQHILFVACLATNVDALVIQGDCTKEDTSCEFSLDFKGWNTMRHVTARKVFISNDNGKLYFLGTNQTVPEGEVILADGYPDGRSVHAVNNLMPGPTLLMYENQNITVHVTNSLPSESFTVHWHGLEVRGTPWMDGAGFITQCPIIPGQTFTYNFMSGRKGTYFYHTHSAGTINMGGLGAIVIKERTEDVMEEHTLIVQDYNNQQTAIDFVLRDRLGTIGPDGNFWEGYPTIDKTYTTAAKMTSSLINGRGRVYDDGASVTKTPLTVFRVKKGERYRFRTINAAVALQYIVSIDNHNLDIVAADGHDVVSTVVDKYTFHSGERFDFILNANQAIGNYWIRVESMVEGNQFPAYAILRYEGAEETDPSSNTKLCSHSDQCSLLGCATSVFTNHSCIAIDQLRSHGANPALLTNGHNVKEFFLNFGLALSPEGMRGVVNGVRYSHPSVSALTQPQEIDNFCTEGHGCGVDRFCNCIQPLSIEFGDVVQLNILNMGFKSVLHHSIHTHGYSFYVLKTGFRRTNEDMEYLGNNLDVDCGSDPGTPFSFCNNASWANPEWNTGNMPNIGLATAPRKDTINVPAGGYTVVRFVADNPGIWFFHCHMETHVNIGMGILLNISFSNIPPPPPGFPECRNYPPPSWILNRDTADITTKDQHKTEIKDDTYESKEFWAAVGTLLAVIVVQFIVLMICLMKKRKSK